MGTYKAINYGPLVVIIDYFHRRKPGGSSPLVINTGSIDID